jgi:hypothetical protein
MPEYCVLIATANYVTAATEEEASEKALAGFLKVLPPALGSAGHWRVVTVEPSPFTPNSAPADSTDTPAHDGAPNVAFSEAQGEE